MYYSQEKKNMKKSNLKRASIAGVIISAIALMANPVMLIAQGSDNSTAELTISAGDITAITPDDFSFGSVFLPPAGDPDFHIYKTLTPLTTGQVIQVDDADDGNFDFNVTMSLSNFTNASTGNVIPFTSFAALTIADNTTDGVDAGSGSPPAGTVNVTAPWSCDWDGQSGDLETNCGADLDFAGFTASGTTIPADPTTAITDTDTTISVTSSASYAIGDVIQFDSGEYAVVSSLVWPTQIKVRRGVSGTNPAPQGAGSGITNMQTQSNEVTILVGPEPVGGRIGSYSVGLGIRALLEPADLDTGSYSGQIVFTLLKI